MKQTQPFELNIVPRGTPPVVHVCQYDVGARAFSAVIYDDSGVMDLSGVSKIEVSGTKPSRIGFIRDDIATIDTSTSTVTWDCTDQMTVTAGRVRCGLTFYDANDNRLGTAAFILDVQEAAVPLEVITEASDFGTLISDYVRGYLEERGGIADISYATRSANGYLWGDANNDGVVDNADGILVSRYIVNDATINVEACDLNGDGEVNNADSIILRRLITAKTDDQILIKTIITYVDGTKSFKWGLVNASIDSGSGGGSSGGGSGEAGVGIYSITYKNTDASGGNVYTITLTDGRTYDITAPRGPDGGKWYTGTAIHGVYTDERRGFPNSGISNAVVGDMYLNTDSYDIYRCVGAGTPSQAWWTYEGNIKGLTPNLTIGAVTTLAAGSNATASITGTASNPVLNLGIPRGADGSGGGSGGSGQDGEDGGYYFPSVDTSGNLTWQASKSGMPVASGANIKGPQGSQGPQGEQGPKGDTGDTGPAGANGTDGGRWYTGSGITGTDPSSIRFVNSGVANAVVGDMYLNTSTYNVYRCMVAGVPNDARWAYMGCIKGADGSGGSSSGGKWHTGTGITGTSQTATRFPSSGVLEAVSGDMYLNTSTYNIYYCMTGGDASTATWAYEGNIKGTDGTNGTNGTDGADGATWYVGTVITHTGDTGGEYPSITSAKDGDLYLNKNTYNIYRCFDVDGDMLWYLVGNIKGADASAKTIKNITFRTRTSSGHLYGDANGDGSIDTADLMTMQRYVDGELTTLPDMQAADVDFDGDVTQDDVDTVSSGTVNGLGSTYAIARYTITYADNTTQVFVGTVPIITNENAINTLIANYVSGLDARGVSY